MPRKRGSWLSTVPSWRDGEEAARELWRGAFRVVPLCRLAMFLNQVRKGVFMVTILLVRAKPRYTGRINFWSMYNLQRFHLFPIHSRQDLNHSCLSDHSILYGIYFRQLPVID